MKTLVAVAMLAAATPAFAANDVAAQLDALARGDDPAPR
jgi:hypothetical protein